MDYKLQTYKECCANASLFEKYDNPNKSGRFVAHENDKKPWVFIWLEKGMLHRLDGPSRIFRGGGIEWWFLGEEVHVNSQNEFEEWVARKISEA